MGEEKENNKITTDEKITFLIGAGIGTIAGLVLSIPVNWRVGPEVGQAKKFEDTNAIIEQRLPSTIRLYRIGRDQILVENPEKKGEYIPFNEYLRQVEEIKGEAERNIRKAELEKLAEWYE